MKNLNILSNLLKNIVLKNNGNKPQKTLIFHDSPPAALAPPCVARTVYDAMRNFSIPRSEGKFNLGIRPRKVLFLRFQMSVGVRGTTFVPGKSFLANRKRN